MKRTTLCIIAASLSTALPALADENHKHPHRHHRPHSHGHHDSAVARGTVYLDANKNGVRDRGERGIGGVSVSNGLDVVQTDRAGNYRIPAPAESVLFISKPAQYDVPVNEDNLPQFYYLHYPEGTPSVAEWDYPVIEPTGPLPRRIDFALLPGRAKHKFKAMAFADPQAGSEQDQDMVRVDIVEPLIDNPFGAEFGITVGDVVNDTLALYERHNRMMAQIGIPMWNLPGNHDINYRSPNDFYSTDTYKSVFGPTNYSFDYGHVHFIALDNVDYQGDEIGGYRGYLHPEQLEWIKNDIAFVDKSKLLVIATHISLVTYALDSNGERYELGGNINTVNLAELLDVIKDFEHVYGMAGHDTSNSWKVEVDHEHGWYGYPFIAHTLGEARGNGWTVGPRDDRGVRAATMQDGNPNGYYLMSFDGAQVEPKFMPASSNPPTPMRIMLDPLLGGTVDDTGGIVAIERGQLLPGTKVVVNLFDGGERDTVWVSIDGSSYVEMENVLRTDPFMERQRAQYAGTSDSFGAPQPSSHLWELELAETLAPGLHVVRVESEDEFGQSAHSAFTFELLE